YLIINLKSETTFLRPERATYFNPRAAPWVYQTHKKSPRLTEITSIKPLHRRKLLPENNTSTFSCA
ncbi:MAG TPA: hypothetical protein VJ937_01960, partial [Salinivirga sp.]|uniref:hypothetical protein n=1 Tax=Salinivirga sp. TaxID=1970192 RepID=UPI002B48CADF